jgi:hypothetical protein
MFNPPSGVTNGAEYTYGNITWMFDANSGVWNVINGTLVGEQGPQGPEGPAGPIGPTGNPVTGDSAAFIVFPSSGSATVRVGGVGTTGVVGFGGGFDVSNGIASNKYASSSVTGVASFRTGDFTVSATGHVRLSLNQNINVFDQLGTKSAISLGDSFQVVGTTGINFLYLTESAASGPYYQVGAKIADTSGTIGVSYFNSSYFTVNSSGRVSLNEFYSATGQEVLAGDYISLSGNRVKTVNNIGVQTLNGLTGPITITGTRHSIPFFDPAITGPGLSGTNTLLFNGKSLTFGSSDSKFAITGPSIIFGSATEITGGVFKNPTEAAPHYLLGVNNTEIVVNGASGSIQRFTIQPNAKATIKTGTSWHPLTTATETIAVIIQNRSGFTAGFDGNILVDGSGSPSILGPSTSSSYGVTGGISVVTIMRVNIGSGKGLTMGFVVSTGMTASGATIN